MFKLNKRQLIEFPRKLNESLENISKDQIWGNGWQAGEEFEKFLDYTLIDQIGDELNEHADFLKDKIIDEIISKIPTAAKDKAFSFLTQDTINDFYNAVKADAKSDNRVFPECGDILDDVFQTNERNKFISVLLRELIMNSTTIYLYWGDDGDIYDFDSIHIHEEFERDIPDDEGIVAKVCEFCSAFCYAYAENLIKRLETKDLKKKFEVTTWWYIPKIDREIVEARDEDEVRSIIKEKYRQYKNSHSEDQKLYNGIRSITAYGDLE